MQQDTPSPGERPDRSLPLLPLDEVVQRGAQALLQRALDVEVELFLERYQYLMDDQGLRLSHGHTDHGLQARGIRGHPLASVARLSPTAGCAQRRRLP